MVVVAVGSLTDSCRVPVHMMIEDSFSITGGEHANFPTSFIEVNQEAKRERGREKRLDQEKQQLAIPKPMPAEFPSTCYSNPHILSTKA